MTEFNNVFHVVGGVTEQYDVRNDDKNLFMIMLKAYERKAMMSCSITPGETMEERLSNGLVAGHAYSVTAVKLVYIERLNGNEKKTIPLEDFLQLINAELRTTRDRYIYIYASMS